MKSGRGRPKVDELVERVREVYRELARRPVERNCIRRTECCQFGLTGKVPQLTRGEAIVLALGIKAKGMKDLPKPAMPEACPLLRSDGVCRAYDARPFGCRTHFCKAAGGTLSRAEVQDLIQELEAVDELLEGSGVRGLDRAVADEIRRMKTGG